MHPWAPSYYTHQQQEIHIGTQRWHFTWHHLLGMMTILVALTFWVAATSDPHTIAAFRTHHGMHRMPAAHGRVPRHSKSHDPHRPQLQSANTISEDDGVHKELESLAKDALPEEQPETLELKQEEKSEERKMLEAAGLIYALNTLFKIAMFSQLLEYGLSSFTRDMLAGAVGALVCVLLLYPLDTVKTWQQLGNNVPQGRGPYRGLVYGMLKECPAGSLYVAVFYVARNALLSCSWISASGFLISTAAVAVATLAASLFRVPFEVMNKRVQAGMTHRGAVQTAFQGSSRMPLLGASWIAVEAREIPFALLQLLLFRYLQSPITALLMPYLPALGQQLACGAIAGGAAAFVTAPFDMITTEVTLARSQEESPKPSLGGVMAQLGGAVSSIFKTYGLLGFWRGNLLRVIYSAVVTCLFYYVVEATRLIL